MVVLPLSKGSNEVWSRTVDGDRGPRTRPPLDGKIDYSVQLEDKSFMIPPPKLTKLCPKQVTSSI